MESRAAAARARAELAADPGFLVVGVHQDVVHVGTFRGQCGEEPGVSFHGLRARDARRHVLPLDELGVNDRLIERAADARCAKVKDRPHARGMAQGRSATDLVAPASHLVRTRLAGQGHHVFQIQGLAGWASAPGNVHLDRAEPQRLGLPDGLGGEERLAVVAARTTRAADDGHMVVSAFCHPLSSLAQNLILTRSIWIIAECHRPGVAAASSIIARMFSTGVPAWTL